MHQPSERWQLGLGLSLLTAVLWGALPVAIKGVLGGMDTNTLIWYRMLSAALLVGAYYLWRGGYQWRRFTDPKIAAAMAIGVAGLCGNYWFWVRGLELSSPEAAQLMIQVAPMLLLVISVVLYKEPFRGWQKLGLAGFSTGLILFFNKPISGILGTTETVSADYTLGVGIVFIAALCWTIYGLAQKQLLKQLQSQEILLTIYISGSILFFPLANPEQLFDLNNQQLGCLIFSCIITVLSYGAFAMAMEHWQASRISATITIVPLLSLGFVHLSTWLLPGMLVPETLNWISWVGVLLVVAGAMATALVREKKIQVQQ